MRLTDIACQEKTLLVYALRVAGASVLVDRALPATHDLESYLTLGPERHTLAAPCEATIFETLPSDLRPVITAATGPEDYRIDSKKFSRRRHATSCRRKALTASGISVSLTTTLPAQEDFLRLHF